MTTINCANTESDEHDTANAAFDEAATHLGELGYVYEVAPDGVIFSRSEPDAGEYDPDAKIAAAAFLGLEGAVDLGSLDQVVGVAAYKGFNRCPVLVCPEVKVNGVRSTYYKFCANPSKFHSKGRHFAVCIGSPLRTTPALSKRAGYSIAKRTWSSVALVYGVWDGPRILFE
jgi:hypothetical protein